MPPEIREAMEEQAAKNRRSLNAEILARLGASLADDTGTGADTDNSDSRYPVKLVLGLPEAVAKKLEITSVRNHRTLNGEVVMRLETTLFDGAEAFADRDPADSPSPRWLAKLLLKKLEEQIAIYDRLEAEDLAAGFDELVDEE